MAGGLAADIAIRVIADIQTAIAIAIIDIVFILIIATVATIAILFVIFVFVIFPHIIAIAEALDDQIIALATAVKLTTPTCGSK